MSRNRPGSYRKNRRRYIKRKKEESNMRIRCELCEIEVFEELPCSHSQRLTIDHIIPLSKGGSCGVKNMRICCWSCNQRKGDMYDEDYIQLD